MGKSAPRGGSVEVGSCGHAPLLNEDGKVSVFLGLHGDTFGDELAPYLFLEPGPGERIDDAISGDRSGRFIVVLQDAALRLIDTRTRHERELTRLERNPWEGDDAFSPPPVARFSHDGQRLLSLRKEAGQVVVIVRELSSGREQRVDAGPGELLSERGELVGPMRWEPMLPR